MQSSRKSLGICFGVCGSPASASENLLAVTACYQWHSQ